MKLCNYLVVSTLLASFLMMNVAAASSPQTSEICLFDNVPVVFKKMDRGFDIINEIAVIDDEAYLSLYYNPYYGIGGGVSLHTQGRSIPILIWGRLEADVLDGSVEYKGLTIECHSN